MTLYVFAPDKAKKSVCYGKCAAFWPPVVVPKGKMVPATMPGITGKFGVAMRTGGARQLTFDGECSLARPGSESPLMERP
jgi:predicted lipoprotein with Yx(FWY)xxD motif